MRFLTLSTIVGVVLVTFAAACGGSDGAVGKDASQLEQTPAPTNTPTPTLTPSPSPTLTATPAPATTATTPLSPSQVFERVSPSIVFLETPMSFGSGIVIDGGYLVTNAHVVWPFEEVRVVFPDGLEIRRAPVVASDLMADIAVVDISERSDAVPAATASGEDLSIGSELFLIGYPGEPEAFPQPTISRGILSRFRTWDAIAMVFLQTDAAAAGGQSGGALVSATGDVVGMSGFTFANESFTLAASMPVVMGRVSGLLAGKDWDGLGDRGLPTEGTATTFHVTLANYYEEHFFVLNAPVGTAVEIEAEGGQDVVLAVLSVDGASVFEVDDTVQGREAGEFTTEFPAPYLIGIGQWNLEAGEFTVRSSIPLSSFDDPDDGRELTVGATVTAALDYYGDVDVFEIAIKAGETIVIIVDSMNIDPLVAIDLADNPDEVLAIDDDSGGGPFGLNARLSFTAGRTARYLVIVQDAVEGSVGGYFLTVE